MPSPKQNFMIKAVDFVKVINSVTLTDSEELRQEWNTLGLASGGSDPIVAADVGGIFNIEPADEAAFVTDLNSFMGVINNFNQLYNNVAVPAASRTALVTNLVFVEPS